MARAARESGSHRLWCAGYSSTALHRRLHHPSIHATSNKRSVQVRWALEHGAVLVSSSKGMAADAMACYADPQRQEAMRAWLREWVWRFEIRRGLFVPTTTEPPRNHECVGVLREPHLMAPVSSLFAEHHLARSLDLLQAAG